MQIAGGCQSIMVNEKGKGAHRFVVDISEIVGAMMPVIQVILSDKESA